MWIRLEIRDPGVVHGERAVEGYSVGTVECYIGTWRRWRMLVEFGISCSSLQIFLYVLFHDLRSSHLGTYMARWLVLVFSSCPDLNWGFCLY